MGTKVIVSDARECDIHKYLKGEKGVLARYDGKTKDGPWANMCEDCFKIHGIGLGTGKGQEYEYTFEKPGHEPEASGLCVDCGTVTYCGFAHGGGHDHSLSAVGCSEKAIGRRAES